MLRKRFKRLFVDNMKMTGFYGYVYDFSVDYDTKYSQIFYEKRMA